MKRFVLRDEGHESRLAVERSFNKLKQFRRIAARNRHIAQ